jgi:SAM-dependent methyltransferase/tetratricopeptide (TPR) repeat protein
LRRVVAVPTAGAVVSVDCTPSVSRIVAGTVSRRVYLLDRSGTPILNAMELDDEVWAVSIDGAGEVVAVGTASKRPAQGALHCYDTGGTRLFTARYRAPVWGVSLSPNGDFLAAGTWGGHLHIYKRYSSTYRSFWRTHQAVTTSGIYGVRVSDTGNAIAAAYDTGVLLFDASTQTATLLGLKSGLYNVSRATADSMAFIGRRGGDVCKVRVRGRRGASRHTSPTVSFLPRLSSRPVCGVAASAHEDLILTGSFDGVVRALTTTGAMVWDFRTEGEAWSVALGDDVRVAVAGSGDGHIYIIDTDCGSGELSELNRCETALRRGSEAALASYVSLSLAVGAYERAANVVLELIAGAKLPSSAAAVLAAGIEETSKEPRHAFIAGNLHRTAGDSVSAVASLQFAANDPSIQSKALSLAGACFRDLRMPTAAQALYHRATQTRPDTDGLRLHYDIARSYEGTGQLRKARQHYEFLSGWDIHYRDTYHRHDILRESTLPQVEAKARHLDYTGPTVTALGPDVPREGEVDESLLPVLAARQRELSLSAGDRRRRVTAARLLASRQVFQPVELTAFGYDIATYAQYEHAQPEDTVKKHLEMLNLTAEITLSSVQRSLDIGTATCRYPRFLGSLGVDACGLDIERNGYDFIRRSPEQQKSPFRQFVQASGVALPLADDSFDLVTCMMGTVNHLSSNERRLLFREAYRVLVGTGTFAVSVWDCGCPFQGFLTIYGTETKERLRELGVVPDTVCQLADEVGFGPVRITRFACFPDRLVYDLALSHVSAYDVERLLEVDLAVRDRDPACHSQMVLILCEKR